jgi:hypothetical protein
MLVMLLAVSASGCGLLGKAKDLKDGFDKIADAVGDLQDLVNDADDADDSDDADDDDDTNDTLFFGEVFYPGDFKELISTFQEFGYVWTTVTAQNETSEWSFYYK